MGMMYDNPTVQRVKVPRLAELLRVGGSDPSSCRRRSAQLAFLSRYLPINLLMTLCNTLVVLLVLMPLLRLEHLLVWALPQLYVMPRWAWLEWRDRRGRLGWSATPERMRILLLEMLLVGGAWGWLFAVSLPLADPRLALLLGVMALAGITITVQSTLIFPLASAMLSAPIIIGTGLGLAMSGAGLAVGLIFAIFVMVTVHGLIIGARHYYIRLAVEDQLSTQTDVLHLLLSEFEANGEEWLFEFDEHGYLTFATASLGTAMDRPVKDIIGSHWTDIIDLKQTPALLTLIRAGSPFRNVMVTVDVDGEDRWWQLSATPKYCAVGRLCGYRGVGYDITDRQRSAERIAELATFDTLTGLVNRRIIHQALADSLDDGRQVALLFVDLDRFKAVNDSYGHGVGDRLLGEVALRLRDVTMERAGARGLAGRLGGDEFAVVLKEPDPGEAVALGAAIIERLSAAYHLPDKLVTVGASIGIAVGPVDGATVEALMRAADLALYDVKGSGRGTIRRFDQIMHRQTEERNSLELDLRNALSAGQLRMVFQPVVDAGDERIVGFEALMRWRHPERGDVPPSIFIPLAEESGMILTLGRWALEESCRAALRWPQHIKLAVNLSPMQFDDTGFVDEVRRVLHKWRIAPGRLELELTESLFLNEREQTMTMLHELIDIGVGIALDDFGTGYSSLGYLQKFPFSCIKVDRSFVQGSASDRSESVAIVQAIVTLADRLDIDTTAEGVETEVELEAMRRLGCKRVQGFYFGHPMPADDAARLLNRAAPVICFAEDGVNLPPPPPRIGAGDLLWRSAGARPSPPDRQALPAPQGGIPSGHH